MTEPPSETLRRRWLAELLPDVAFDGWTEAAARLAAGRAGLSEGEQALAAPQGVVNLIDAFFDELPFGTNPQCRFMHAGRDR